MDHNENNDDYTPINLKKELGKVLVISAANVVGQMIGLLVFGFLFGKAVEYVNARKAKKALMQD